jgi:peptide/nickel transport system substrate-binding protein
VTTRIKRLGFVAGIAAASLAIIASVGQASGAHKNTKSTSSRGGTLRVGWEGSWGFTDNLDPTGEYLGDAQGILDNLLVRTLVGYKHTAGAPGNQVVPDLATSVPTPTDGGKTYTFHLKSGIKFGPPVNRAVTSKDIEYALERIAHPKDGAQYAFYYSVIKGFDAYSKGQAKSISGIATPNASTIVFHLTQPTGDFLKRMSMPATGPIPHEVAKCFEGQAGKYAQDLVSTAGYMIQGIDKVDISSCQAMQPASGYDATHLFVVRNPNYRQSTDPTRKNYVDEVDFEVNSSADDIYNKIEANQLDLATSSIPPQVLRKYVTDSSLRSHLFKNAGDRTWYLTMTLTQPPFDDIHVRKAMNLIMDKPAMIQAWGGPTIGAVANHIVPDTLFDNQLSEYDPYKTPGSHGSVALARAAMKGSKYDLHHNGMCSAPACHNVLMITDTRSIDSKLTPVVQADAKKIGITLSVRQVNGAYPTIQTVSKNIPLSDRPGWGKDFADPETFFSPLFDGRNIIPNGNTNYSLVGITPKQCKTLHVTGDCANVPSVAPQLDKCSAELGQPRMTCYEKLDEYLMTKVVPWVPYLQSYVVRITSNRVTHYQFDQFPTTPAWSQISVSG